MRKKSGSKAAAIKMAPKDLKTYEVLLDGGRSFLVEADDLAVGQWLKFFLKGELVAIFQNFEGFIVLEEEALKNESTVEADDLPKDFGNVVR